MADEKQLRKRDFAWVCLLDAKDNLVMARDIYKKADRGAFVQEIDTMIEELDHTISTHEICFGKPKED